MKIIIKLMLIGSLVLVAISTNAHATPQLQAQVKDYIRVQMEFMTHMERGSIQRSLIFREMKDGNYDAMDDESVRFATNALFVTANNGALDACCWNQFSQPYPNWPWVKGWKMLTYQNSPSSRNAEYKTIWNNTRFFYIGDRLREDYRKVQRLLQIVASNNVAQPPFGDQKFERHEYDFMTALVPLWGALGWAFSYADHEEFKDPLLSAGFRQNYAFACIICFGAGFYDVSKMHDLQPDGSWKPNRWYWAFRTRLAGDNITWWNNQRNNQFPRNINWHGWVPMQTSIGPTWQSSGAGLGNPRAYTNVYPTHCHGSTEVYKPLHPMDMIERYGNNTAKNMSVQIINEIIGEAKSLNNNNPAVTEGRAYWSEYGQPAKNLGPQYFHYVDGPFGDGRVLRSIGGGLRFLRTTEIGDILFNDERRLHALNSGGWVQLTAWSRLTSPAEGTYFPLHNLERKGNRHATVQRKDPVGGCRHSPRAVWPFP